MIYFDNAATGGFKPHSVISRAEETMKYMSVNPNRSSHRLAISALELVTKTRTKANSFFNNDSISKVIFTKNCTEGLNIIIHSLAVSNSHVITSIFDHNSVLRPLEHLKTSRNIAVSYAKNLGKNGISLENIEPLVNKNTKLIIISHISNVTGHEANLFEIGQFCKNNDIRFCVDAAQSGGHVLIDMQKMNIDALSLAPHKGMYAVGGSGLLIFRDEINLSPLCFGGTGTDTFSLSQPNIYPEYLESGTLNLPAIASIYEGLCHIEKNFASYSGYLSKMTKLLRNELLKIPNIKVYSVLNHAGIVSFEILNNSSQDVAEILNEKYDIAIRPGYHCAPLIHKHLKTDTNGLVRASICPYNSLTEIEIFVSAIKDIANN